MIASIPSAVLVGVDGKPVSVEVHVSNGLPGFTVVGLPDAAVRESRDRVRAALLSSGLSWPLRRVTVNLAPSGHEKGRGRTRPAHRHRGPGGLRSDRPPTWSTAWPSWASWAWTARFGVYPGWWRWPTRSDRHRLVVPAASAGEARLAGDVDLLTSTSLAGLVVGLAHREQWSLASRRSIGFHGDRRSGRSDGGSGSGDSGSTGGSGWPTTTDHATAPDLADVRGQPTARRALEVAAAGGHHLLLVGPPGSGKSMLAARLPGLLPDLSRADGPRGHPHPFGGRSAAACSRADSAPPLPCSPPRSLGGGHDRGWDQRDAPRRDQSVPWGCALPRRDGGVPRLGARRPPPAPRGGSGAGEPGPGIGHLSGPVHPGRRHEPLSRAGTAGHGVGAGATPRRRSDTPDVSPALCSTVSTWPSGWTGRPPRRCMAPAAAESSSLVAARVAVARRRALDRGVAANAHLASSALDRLAPMSVEAASLVERSLRSGALSARGLHRVQRLARTLADLEDAGPVIQVAQIGEALALRAGRGQLLSVGRRR